MSSKNSILLRLDVLEPRFQPGLEHRRSNFHHVLCTFKLSADVLRWQAIEAKVPSEIGFEKWKTEGYPLFFRLISHVLLSQAKMYFEVTQVVWVAGKYVLSFPDSTYQEYKLGLPTESSLAYDKSYHTFNMLDCLRIRVAAPFCVEVDVTQAKDVARGKRVFGEVAAICEVSETDGTLINISKICKTLVKGSLGASDG